MVKNPCGGIFDYSILENADIETFEDLGDGSAKDKNNFYKDGLIVEEGIEKQ